MLAHTLAPLEPLLNCYRISLPLALDSRASSCPCIHWRTRTYILGNFLFSALYSKHLLYMSFTVSPIGEEQRFVSGIPYSSSTIQYCTACNVCPVPDEAVCQIVKKQGAKEATFFSFHTERNQITSRAENRRSSHFRTSTNFLQERAGEGRSTHWSTRQWLVGYQLSEFHCANDHPAYLRKRELCSADRAEPATVTKDRCLRPRAVSFVLVSSPAASYYDSVCRTTARQVSVF
jgi:hypothetical protein